MDLLLKKLSKVSSIPGVNILSPAGNVCPSHETTEGYLRCQRLAQKAAFEVSQHIQEGWTEVQTTKLFKSFLLDLGVQSFFHHPFAWFGERTRFEGIKNYSQFSPSKRVIRPGEVFILDVAPIYRGYVADIGYSSCLGQNAEFNKAQAFLKELRKEIPQLFALKSEGGVIWNKIDQRIVKAGYDNIHKKYPFSVLGHRVHETNDSLGSLRFLNFGWQSFWSIASRGVFGQLLNSNYVGDLTGLWAIEPHIGSPSFGAKFEEILLIEPNRVKWIETNPQYGNEFL